LASATNSEKAKILAAFRKMVKSVRRNEQEGLIIPGDIDPDTGKPYFDFELLTSGGSRQFDTNAIIQRYEQRILMSVLADFILVGHEGVGSYALHTDKTGMFRASVDSISEAIAETLNRHLIPRLFLVNGTKTTKLPKFVPSKVDPPDLGQLASFMGGMSSAGVQWFPDPEMERFVRRIAQLPELQEDAEKVREQEYKQANVLRLANQQVEALTLQGQVQQQIVANEQPPMPPEQPAPPGQPAPQQPKPAPQAQPQNRSKP
jgi:hypothetical protein